MPGGVVEGDCANRARSLCSAGLTNADWVFQRWEAGATAPNWRADHDANTYEGRTMGRVECGGHGVPPPPNAEKPRRTEASPLDPSVSTWSFTHRNHAARRISKVSTVLSLATRVLPAVNPARQRRSSTFSIPARRSYFAPIRSSHETLQPFGSTTSLFTFNELSVVTYRNCFWWRRGASHPRSEPSSSLHLGVSPHDHERYVEPVKICVKRFPAPAATYLPSQG